MSFRFIRKCLFGSIGETVFRERVKKKVQHFLHQCGQTSKTSNYRHSYYILCPQHSVYSILNLVFELKKAPVHRGKMVQE